MSGRPFSIASLIALAIGSGPAVGQGAAAPVLALPIDCTIGVTCFVQQYFDHDPGPEAKDYRCGSKVYDGHDGTDIRLPTIAAQQRGVAVLAAASGVVLGTRNGEPDQVVRNDADRAAIKGRECGNGVLIEHAGGWQTQYCHMAKGSVRVAVGQSVGQGDALGLVGLSGDTQFPHVHLSVREGPRKVDPFAPAAAPGSCGAAGPSLWSPQAAAALAYKPTEIINVGFAQQAVTFDDIDAESARTPDATTPIVFYGRAIGLQGGDQVVVRLMDPTGATVAESRSPLDRPKAQAMSFAGRKPPSGGWKGGTYRGSFAIWRNGQVAVEKQMTLALR